MTGTVASVIRKQSNLSAPATRSSRSSKDPSMTESFVFRFRLLRPLVDRTLDSRVASDQILWIPVSAGVKDSRLET
jgi:hypothetical protein